MCRRVPFVYIVSGRHGETLARKEGAPLAEKLIINGVGAVTTGVATLIIAGTKFLHGAWIVFVLYSRSSSLFFYRLLPTTTPSRARSLSREYIALRLPGRKRRSSPSAA